MKPRKKVKIEGDRGYWTATTVERSCEFSSTFPPLDKYCGTWKWRSKLFPGFVLESSQHLNGTTGMVDEYEGKIRSPYESLGLRVRSQKEFETMFIIPTGCPIEEQLLLSDLTTWPVIRHKRFILLFPKYTDEKGFEFRLHRSCYLSWTCSGCTRSMNNDTTDDSLNPICPARKCLLGGEQIERF